MTSFIPKGWTKSADSHAEDGDSLLTVLPTTQDRSALTILIAECTELMRQAISDTFDANQTGIPSQVIEELTEDVEEQLVLNPEADVIHANEAEQTREERAKKAFQQRQQEVLSEVMVELKSKALRHVDDWRQAVVQRVGEIVNSRKTAEDQKEAASPPQVQKSEQPVKLDEHTSVTTSMVKVFPPVENSLTNLEQEKRVLILHAVLLLLLSLENYSAYSRILLLRLATSLQLSTQLLRDDEAKVALGLLKAAEMQAEEETKQAAEKNKDNRQWKVGLATVAGAALIGITGGLAAPLLAAGIGSVMGGLGLGATAAAGYLGTLAGSSVLVGGLFGAYGGRMTGKMMDQYAREVEDFAFVPVKGKNDKDSRRLRVAIGISGWLTSKQEVVTPWRVVGVGLETFALRFELEPLMNLGNALTTMITSAAWGYAKSEIIKRTVFAALSAGLWPLGLLKVSRVIDNPWSVANYRAIKAGEVLADALINKAQGERPVTMVGYSLGAKVIATCLKRLAERHAFGLVESVVLIGTPTPSDSADWRAIRAVVTGRVVNVYSTKDYILGFLYRSSSIQLGVAGLQPIEGVAGVENVDVSDLVSGHTDYRFLTGAILRQLGFEDVDAAELEIEQKARQAETIKEQKEQEGHVMEKKEVSDADVKELEDEVERKNQQSYVDWAQEKMTMTGTSAAAAYEQAKKQYFTRSVKPHDTHTRKEDQEDSGSTLFDADEAVVGSPIGQKETINVETEKAIL